MADLLRAEPLLIARLQAETSVPEHHVLAAADLEGVEISRQVTPAIHVLYWDDVPGETPGDGPQQLVTQQWIVVVTVQNKRGGRTGTGAREDAGPLLGEVVAALQGYRLAQDFAPLRRVRAPRRAYDSGFAYFPTLWQTVLNTP